jgi:predicted TIM-barrel fold metal-dependent hydrolase
MNRYSQDMAQNDRSALSRRDVSRRDVLKGIAAAAAGVMLPASALVAQNARTTPGPIDMHQHIGGAGGLGGDWSVQKVQDLMGKNGISAVIFSNAGSGDQLYTGTESGSTFARKWNENAAKIVSDHPKIFGFFAAIPFPDADGSLKEIAYAYDTLKADGIGILSSIGDKYPGDALFRPPWEEMNRRKAITFTHPFVPKCCLTLFPAARDSVERDFDTTRAFTNLLYSGTLAELPDIRYIVNHSGATLPVLAGRIKDRVPGAASTGGKPPTDGISPKTPKGVFYEYQKLYYECAHAAYAAPMAALLAFVPKSQLLFGTDYPAEDPSSTLLELKRRNLPPDVLRALYRENAERLFPRFKA